MDDKVLNFVNALNSKAYLDNIKVPILDGFKVVKGPRTIFSAVSDTGYIEQFVLEGKLDEKETFDKRLEKVISETKAFMSKNNMEDPEKNLKYYCDYSNNQFNFKVYTQDNIISKNDKKRFIRQFNIYFIDKNNIFYEVTFSSSVFELPVSGLILDKIDIENDLFTHNMYKTVTNIMDKIEYK